MRVLKSKQARLLRSRVPCRCPKPYTNTCSLEECAMRKMSYAGAIVEALRTSLSEDPTFSLVGSYVLGLGPKRVLIPSVLNFLTVFSIHPRPKRRSSVSGLALRWQERAHLWILVPQVSVMSAGPHW